MPVFSVEPDGHGFWDVKESGRVVDRFTTKQQARSRAEQFATDGDTLQLLTQSGTLDDEFLVSNGELVSAFDETTDRKRDGFDDHGGGGGGLFGAGRF